VPLYLQHFKHLFTLGFIPWEPISLHFLNCSRSHGVWSRCHTVRITYAARSIMRRSGIFPVGRFLKSIQIITQFKFGRGHFLPR
jgi:hypothetical protein